MAPKEPQGEKPVKAPKKRARKASGKRTRFRKRMKRILKSPFCLYAGGLFVMGSIIGATMLTYLYVKELQRRAIFEEGTSRILKTIESLYPDLCGADDITKFKKAENLSMAIFEERRKINEIDHAIREIEQRLHEEWVVWHGALYLFDFIATPRTWKQCIQLCNSMKYNTKLICIENEEEEAFVVSNVRNRPTDYFIGVSMVDSDWLCHDKSFRINEFYWDYNKPENKGPAQPDTANCVIIRRGCEHMYHCWHDVFCHDLKRCICKMNPVQKWMK